MKQRERMIELASRIATLRNELSRLESQLDRLLAEARDGSPLRALPRGRNGSADAMSARVVGLLESNPGRPLGAREIARRLELVNINSLRGTLGRLAKSGRIVRAGRGSFRASRRHGDPMTS